MLKSTTKLLEQLKLEEKERTIAILQSHVDTILKLGTKEDASALLHSFLASPSDFDHTYLIPLFKKFGDETFAEKIFQVVISDNKLVDSVDPAVLTLLGDLRYEPVKEILFDYAFSQTETDYYLHRAAALGLLNFDCLEFADVIEKNIDSCLNKNLFPEFTPAFVCKLPDRKQKLKELYKSGNEFASTDCNAGILLGFSLCAEEGKKYFKQALFNPGWEAYSGSTGTLHFAYQGLTNLQITLSELYDDIRRLTEKTDISYCLTVLFSLFDRRISDFENEGMEDFQTLYKTFFGWESHYSSNNLIDLATIVDREDEADEYRKLFEIKMKEEIMIENYSR